MVSLSGIKNDERLDAILSPPEYDTKKNKPIFIPRVQTRQMSNTARKS